MRTGSFTSGEGPGAITADGCAVDLYAELPVGREPEVIHAAVPGAASILELGCGAGRVTRPLVALGYEVTAVDESAEMLAHVTGARTVKARIEDLDLPDRFDVVLLASHLVNVPDDALLASLLACTRRHVKSDGCVILERHPANWFDQAAPSEQERDGITFVLRGISRPAHDLLRATVEYRIGARVWSQTFTTRRLDDVRLAAVLHAAGLRFDTVLTDDGSWVRAVPA